MPQNKKMIPSPAQQEAICFGEGTMLVLAGPGSGKTAVITQRIRYLVEERHITPSDILTITFTKAAALEMKRRACQICRGAGKRCIWNISFCFFSDHQIFFKIPKLFHYDRTTKITDIKTTFKRKKAGLCADVFFL